MEECQLLGNIQGSMRAPCHVYSMLSNGTGINAREHTHSRSSLLWLHICAPAYLLGSAAPEQCSRSFGGHSGTGRVLGPGAARFPPRANRRLSQAGARLCLRRPLAVSKGRSSGASGAAPEGSWVRAWVVGHRRLRAVAGSVSLSQPPSHRPLQQKHRARGEGWAPAGTHAWPAAPPRPRPPLSAPRSRHWQEALGHR